jgi:hypothetical protein
MRERRSRRRMKVSSKRVGDWEDGRMEDWKGGRVEDWILVFGIVLFLEVWGIK